MIKKFSVENFRGFKDKIVLDLSRTRDYDFNKQLIVSGITNKALIYGPNSSGKSNLGFALMDIASHLTDNNGNSIQSHIKYPKNFESNKSDILFEYVFCFNGKDITYRYAKNDHLILQSEEILADGKTIFYYDYVTSKYTNLIEETKSVNISNRVESISAIKYIRNNMFSFSEDNPIKLIVDFANQMLWFRSLRVNEFIGTNTSPEDIAQYIITNDYVDDFNDFLKKYSVNEYAVVEETNNGKRIYTKKGDRSLPFFDACSTGTVSLTLLYYWKKKRFDDIQFLFVDEFDAFYHTKVSQMILKEINALSNFQSILTTHNSNLADNSLMRPDCYFILKDNVIKNFSDRTIKTIREGNNVGKMMLADEFE